MKKYVKADSEENKSYFEITYYVGQGMNKGKVVLAKNIEEAEEYGRELSEESINELYDLAMDEVDKRLHVEPCSKYSLDWAKKHNDITEL